MFRAGGIFKAPVRFEVGTGAMRLGNWEEQGLAGFSGEQQSLTPVGAGLGLAGEDGSLSGECLLNHGTGEMVHLFKWRLSAEPACCLYLARHTIDELAADDLHLVDQGELFQPDLATVALHMPVPLTVESCSGVRQSGVSVAR